jgi:hypothetical protein
MAVDMPASMDHAMVSDRGTADAENDISMPSNDVSTDDMFSNDMPCCPGKPSLPDCGKDCPFMALCGAIVLHGVSHGGLIVPLTLAAVILPGDPSALVSHAHAPPRKPPKA